jgi:hypothetical protein
MALASLQALRMLRTFGATSRAIGSLSHQLSESSIERVIN